jgi:nucleotide-binding universal stress UspA family protein
MPSIKKILFPVDFSQRAVGAVRYIESIAGRFEAEIMLLHVIDLAAHVSLASRVQPSRQEQLESFPIGELKHFVTRTVVSVGDPTEEIVKTVRSWGPDLVMMPSYGLGFFRPSLLGSVTAKVLHDIGCPVWTSVHADEAPPLEHIGYKKVLCAIDLKGRSRQIFDWARYFAGKFHADLGVVHAIPLVEAPPLLAEARGRISALMSAADANATVLVDGGEPPKSVTCAAKDFHADLLVIGRHSSSSAGDEGYLRHNAYDIIRESPCPVISI